MPESKTHLRAANDAAVLPSVQGAGISVIKTRGSRPRSPIKRMRSFARPHGLEAWTDCDV